MAGTRSIDDWASSQPTGTLTHLLGTDAANTTKRQEVVELEAALVAVATGTPSNTDILNFIESDDSVFRKITYANFIAALRSAVFGWPDIASGNRVFLDQMTAPANSPGNIGTGYTRCFPFRLWRPLTITELGARVGTGGGNSRFGIYQNAPSVRRPGTLICATGSVATSAGGTTSGTLVDSAGSAVSSVAVPAGVYWAAVRVDNATVQFAGMGANTIFSSMLGDPTIDLLGSSNVGNRALDYNYTGAGFAENFAADLTAVTPTSKAFNNANALLVGKVA